MAQIVALMADRREEIRAVAKLYREMMLSIGEESATKVLCEAIDAEACASGRGAAPREKEKAGLAHYLSVFARHGSDGGMGQVVHTIAGNRLTIDIGRCDYFDLYHSSDLPSQVASSLCCGREAQFARGYDTRLKLVEKATREERPGDCHLVYLWDETAQATEPGAKVTLRVR